MDLRRARYVLESRAHLGRSKECIHVLTLGYQATRPFVSHAPWAGYGYAGHRGALRGIAAHLRWYGVILRESEPKRQSRVLLREDAFIQSQQGFLPSQLQQGSLELDVDR